MTCNSLSPACLPQELAPSSSHKPVIMAWLAVVIPVHFMATIRRFVKCGLSLFESPLPTHHKILKLTDGVSLRHDCVR